MSSSLPPPLLEAENLSRIYYPRNIWNNLRGRVTSPALSHVSFVVEQGKTLAIVGESGAGKSTLARLVALIDSPDEGRVRIDGKEVTRCTREEKRQLRADIQMVFQNPYASLNPRHRVKHILEEPLSLNRSMTRMEKQTAIKQMLHNVGLPAESYDAYPHMFSGGQQQRIAIARALMLHPRLLILDEPLSALDLSVRAQILALFLKLQKEFHLTYLFISHDLKAVHHLADDVLVLEEGKVVEYAPKENFFSSPQNPYTHALLSAILPPYPTPEWRRAQT